MNATNGTALTLSRRVKSTVVTGLLMLSLVAGAGAASMRASAAAPPPGPVIGVPTTTGPTYPTDGGTDVAKPKGGKTPKKASGSGTVQPPLFCHYYTQAEAIFIFDEDPGPGGIVDCNFLPSGTIIK